MKLANQFCAKLTIMVFGVIAFSACSTLPKKIENFSDSPPKHVKVIISHSIISKESLPGSVFFLVDLGGIASGPIGPLVAGVANGILFTTYGEERVITMLNKLDQETYRQVSCAFIERGYDVTFAGFNTWKDLEKVPDIESADDFYTHLESNYGYQYPESLSSEHDAVVLVEYFMQLQDKSVGDSLTDLRIDGGYMRVVAAPREREGELIFRDTNVASRGYSRYQLSRMYASLIEFDGWPLIESVVEPQCGSKGVLQTRISSELTTRSDREEIRAFFARHNIGYRWNRRQGTYTGKFTSATGPELIEDTVKVIVYYDKQQGLFRHAEVFYDR